MLKTAQDSRGGKYTHSLLFLSTRQIRCRRLSEEYQVVSSTCFIGFLQMQISADADRETHLHRLFQHDPEIPYAELRKFLLYSA